MTADGGRQWPNGFQAWADEQMGWWVTWLTRQAQDRLPADTNLYGSLVPPPGPLRQQIRELVRQAVLDTLAAHIAGFGCLCEPIHPLVRGFAASMRRDIAAVGSAVREEDEATSGDATATTGAVSEADYVWSHMWGANHLPGLEPAPWDAVTSFSSAMTEWLLTEAALAILGQDNRHDIIVDLADEDPDAREDWHGLDTENPAACHNPTDGPVERCPACAPNVHYGNPVILVAQFLANHCSSGLTTAQYLRIFTWLVNIPVIEWVALAIAAGLTLTEAANRWAHCREPGLSDQEQTRRLTVFVEELHTLAALRETG